MLKGQEKTQENNGVSDILSYSKDIVKPIKTLSNEDETSPT